jgi:hypothetical protein
VSMATITLYTQFGKLIRVSTNLPGNFLTEPKVTNCVKGFGMLTIVTTMKNEKHKGG